MWKSKIYSLHSGVYSSCTHWGSSICQRGIFASIHREALTWQTEINLPLRITLSACVWPEGRLSSLKLMQPVNSTSGWHSWLASLLEMAWLQVPLHHPHIVFQPHSKGLTILALDLWGSKNSQGQQKPAHSRHLLSLKKEVCMWYSSESLNLLPCFLCASKPEWVIQVSQRVNPKAALQDCPSSLPCAEQAEQ